jgi:hypothetical protein
LACGAVNHELGVVVLGLFLAWVALAHAALVILTAVPRRSTCFRLLCGVVAHAHPGDPDLCLDIKAVQVMAVFTFGPEILACLHGGTGFCCDSEAGGHKSCQIDDAAIAWRCAGRRAACKLAGQLKAWQAAGTPLRLLSARGRCAVLMEDERSWLTLPEIRARA